MKQKVILISIILIPIVILSCNSTKSEWQGAIEVVDGVTVVNNPKEGLWDLKENTSATFQKELQIGELYGPEELLFVYMSDVAVNSKGDIYIADNKLSEIRKFNKDGEHLLTLGRKGQGPGEFQYVRIIALNHNDDLIAYDGRMGRISIFSDEGIHIETTKKLIETSWIDPSYIYDLDKYYVVFGSISNGSKLFHDFNKDWKLIRSYIDYQFGENKDFEKQSRGFSLGHCWLQNNGDFLYTKYFYDNQIFTYRNNEVMRIMIQESDIKQPYHLKIFQDVRKASSIPRDPEYDFRSFGQGVAYFAAIYQASLGIFQLTNGHIVNFIQKRISNEVKEFGVEIFDSTGKFLFYSKLGENHFYDIRCMDENDLFYVIDRKEYHKILVFRLEY